MKKTIIAGSLSAFLLLPLATACFAPAEPATNVQPAEGPADSEPTDEPTETESPESEDTGVASFSEKYVYGDGVEVEVTRISHGKVTLADTQYSDLKAGDTYVVMSFRVRNGSQNRLKAYQSETVTYGPDGDEAEAPYLSNVDTTDMDGTILPGRSKTGKEVFLIPAKHQDNVTLELDWDLDFEHGAAIFAGSVK